MINIEQFHPDNQIIWFINGENEITKGWLYHGHEEGMYDVGGMGTFATYYSRRPEEIWYTCLECAVEHVHINKPEIYKQLGDFIAQEIDTYITIARSWRGKYGAEKKKSKNFGGIITSLQDELHNYKEALFEAGQKYGEIFRANKELGKHNVHLMDECEKLQEENATLLACLNYSGNDNV